MAQLHKFMASLTDTRWKMDGKTVLYIPHEGTIVPVSPTTAKNKELIHLLESMLLIAKQKNHRHSHLYLSQLRLALDLATAKGCKAELT